MKKINFKKLYIKNFLSIGNEPLEIDFNTGMNVITGVNRDENDISNAVGKSSISDAFYFVLFGNTMRELSKLSFIVNRKVGKNCVVRLEADIETPGNIDTYLIERKLAPQSLKIWKDGVEVTKSTTAETNKYIEEVFYAEKDIFQNCVLMRANNTIPFMARKKQEKKNFIETIFNLNIFSLMSRILKEDIRTTKGNYSLEKNTQSLHESNIANYQRELDRLIDLQNQYETRKQRELDAINEKVDNENRCIVSYNTAIDELFKKWPKDYDLNAINSSLIKQEEFKTKLNIVKSQLYIEEGVLRRDLKRLETVSGVCPTCKRAYSDEHITHINEEKLSLNEKLEEILQKITIVAEKTEEIEGDISKAKEIINKDSEYRKIFNELQLKIAESKRIINVYEEQIKSKDIKEDFSGIENFNTLIKSTQETLNKVQKTVKGLERELGMMNICEHILGEYGVRAYIVNKLLDLFNNRIMYYLSSIKSTFNFRFNEYFEEEIKDSNGVICLYNNCSGAEMKKIDLAISFAINDMLSLQRQISYNIIFFDEILDSSLDDKSLNIILNFISEHTHKENKAVYIISHKSGAQIPFINEVIMLEKSNGFTKRIYNE